MPAPALYNSVSPRTQTVGGAPPRRTEPCPHCGLGVGGWRDDDIVSPREAAWMLGLSHKTLATWRCRTTRGPRYIKLGRAVRYRVGELRRWIAAKGTRSHTNSPPQDLGAA